MRSAIVASCVAAASAYVGTPVVLGKSQVRCIAACGGSPNAQSARLVPLAHVLANLVLFPARNWGRGHVPRENHGGQGFRARATCAIMVAPVRRCWCVGRGTSAASDYLCYVVRQAPAVAKTSSFMPALRSADPVVGATGRASLRMPKQTIVMAEAKKSVKDLSPSALKGKKVIP